MHPYLIFSMATWGLFFFFFPFSNSNHKEEVCDLYVTGNLWNQLFIARENTRLVRQLRQAGWITKDRVISKVPCEIRDLHYTREMKCKGKARCE